MVVVSRSASAASNLDAAKQKRDQLIREAVQSGGGLREVGRAAGLTHAGVLSIINREKP